MKKPKHKKYQVPKSTEKSNAKVINFKANPVKNSGTKSNKNIRIDMTISNYHNSKTQNKDLGKSKKKYSTKSFLERRRSMKVSTEPPPKQRLQLSDF